MMGRTADPAVAAVWRERLQRQRRERVSIVEFCEQEGVSTAAFYQWRQRLAQGRQRGVAERATNESVPTFLPVQLNGVSSISNIEIELPGGAVAHGHNRRLRIRACLLVLS